MAYGGPAEGEPRLNRDRTRVICGHVFLDTNKCEEWLAWWSDGPSPDGQGPGSPRDTWPEGPENYDYEAYIHSGVKLRAGFRRDEDGVFRETLRGQRRRFEGTDDRRPDADSWGIQGRDSLLVRCPSCHQDRLLDPENLRNGD
jgi:hypothetical protein